MGKAIHASLAFLRHLETILVQLFGHFHRMLALPKEIRQDKIFEFSGNALGRNGFVVSIKNIVQCLFVGIGCVANEGVGGLERVLENGL